MRFLTWIWFMYDAVSSTVSTYRGVRNDSPATSYWNIYCSFQLFSAVNTLCLQGCTVHIPRIEADRYLCRKYHHNSDRCKVHGDTGI
ncbi:hypothetical protein A0H81_00888 [Grifola frondosa]|uniref:Secreted protein n=1 Tax=Grifola frondosa TaxID=5627 RepID=A0A1C7MR17_GRIFR|nr:hypothetical protein A0H81_00888 [Grifola frondosa]